MSECLICGKAILNRGINYGGSPDSICHGHFFPKPPSNVGNVAQGLGAPSQVIGCGLQQVSSIASSIPVMEREISLAAIREAKNNLVQAIRTNSVTGDAEGLAKAIEELIVQYIVGERE